MTPIIFVSFLVSLALVDFQYYAMRVRSYEEEDSGSRLPAWLHRLVYRPQPYQYVRVTVDQTSRGGRGAVAGAGAGRSAERNDSRGWYYHSKQRKLMKMEVDDAFAIRSTVLAVMGVLVLVFGWVLWQVARWGLRILGFRT